MSLSPLRQLKKEWMQNTCSANHLKTVFKLTSKEISQLPTETRYNKTRYPLYEVKQFLDRKITHPKTLS